MSKYIDFWEKKEKIELYPQMLDYFKSLLGEVNDQNRTYIVEQLNEAEEIYRRYEQYIIPKALIKIVPLNNQSQDEYENITNEIISYMGDQDQNNRNALIIAAVKCQEIELSDVMEELYLHMWQTASINVGRDYIMSHFNILVNKNKIKDKSETGHTRGRCTPWFGPGLSNIPWHMAEKFGYLLELKANIIDGNQFIEIREKGMYPNKAFLGGFLLLDSDSNREEQSNPCKLCPYKGRCEYCMYRNKKAN